MPWAPDSTPSPTDDLQFNTVEPVNPPGVAPLPQQQLCAQCQQPIRSNYFAVRHHILCPDCAAAIGGMPTGLNPVAFVVALVMGIGAGLLGTLIWYGVRHIFKAEIGLIAVLVGFLVGKAVRKGSGGRGGLAYQVMAVVLTYICISANYVPDVIQAMREGTTLHGVPTARDLLFAFWFSMRLPFLGGVQSAIGLLIIGFALWEAWKFTKFYRIPLTGPYQLAPMRPLSLAPLPYASLPDASPSDASSADSSSADASPPNSSPPDSSPGVIL